MSGMDYETAMRRLRSGPLTRVELIDHGGAPIGCVGYWPDGSFCAIAPSGRTRDCATREAAVWWLKETAARRDPERAASPDAVDIGLLVVAGAATIVVAAAIILS